MLPKRNIYNRKYTKEDFVERANIVHKNKFTYPSEYINSITKIEICCPVHGIFTQVPASHLSGIGCPACSGNKRHTTEELIKDAKEVYGDLYILDKIRYTNSMIPFEVICRKHGSFFKTRAEFIGNKSGCNKCSRQTLDTELFKELAYEKHGDFTMRPDMHLHNTTGCPTCNSSKGELKIYHFLKNKKIKFIKKYRLKNYAYRYDFYLPDYDLFIEYHGEQHYKVVTTWGGEEGLKKRMKHDKIKRNLVKKVLQKEILEIPYTKFNKIIDILKKKLNIT